MGPARRRLNRAEDLIVRLRSKSLMPGTMFKHHTGCGRSNRRTAWRWWCNNACFVMNISTIFGTHHARLWLATRLFHEQYKRFAKPFEKGESKMRFRISLNLQNSYHLEIVHVIVNSQLVGSCQLGFWLDPASWGFQTCYVIFGFFF